jgi:hypothetical protein
VHGGGCPVKAISLNPQMALGAVRQEWPGSCVTSVTFEILVGAALLAVLLFLTVAGVLLPRPAAPTPVARGASE